MEERGVIIRYGGELQGINYVGGFAVMLIISPSVSLANLHREIATTCGISFEFNLRSVVNFNSSYVVDISSDRALSNYFRTNEHSDIEFFVFPTQINSQNESIHHMNLDYTRQNEFNTSQQYNHDALAQSVNIPNMSNQQFNFMNVQHQLPSSSHQGIYCNDQTRAEEVGNGDLNNSDDDDDLEADQCMNTKTKLFEELYEGKTFANVKKFREKILEIVVRDEFEIKYVSNNQHKIIAKCISGKNCTWRVYGKTDNNGILLTIRTFCLLHTCLGRLRVGNHPQATSNWVKSKIVGRIRDDICYSPIDIVKDILRDHGVEISYSKAWKARELAMVEVHGCSKDAYKNMDHFVQTIIETNPGSKCFLQTSEEGRFERVFIFFKSCIDGFMNGCLPIVGLDGTFLTGRYKSVLLGAVATDPNNGIFPLAYAIVEAEDQYSWTWFLDCFQRSLPHIDPRIYFVSDKQKGLIIGVRNIFPNHHHFFCMKHFRENIKSKFNDKNVDLAVWLAAKSYDLIKCNYYLEVLKGESLAAYNWILDSQTNPDHNIKYWAMSHSPVPRYRIVTSNFVESFNAWILNLKSKPVTGLLDGIRCKIVKLQHKRRQLAQSWLLKECVLVDHIQKKLSKRLRKSRRNLDRPLQVNFNSFEVRDRKKDATFKVDLDGMICSCGKWFHTQFPCQHGIASYSMKGIQNNITDYCPDLFKIPKMIICYESSMEPVTNPIELQHPPHRELPILPPICRRPPGRPTTKRRQANFGVRPIHCSNCNEVGHNKSSCRALNPTL